MSRDTLKRRIAALREKTTARGCTEAEALAAAAKAAELMREHGISEADLVMDEQSVRRKTSGNSVRDRLWRAVAHCTNTASILTVENSRPVRCFVGREPGPQIATYLYVVLDRAIDRAIAEFKSGPIFRRRKTDKSKRRAVAEFTAAMVMTLRERLYDLFRSTISDEALTAAVLALNERYPDRAPVALRKRSAVKVTQATWDGLAAGGKVGLHHGMAGTGPAALIGGDV